MFSFQPFTSGFSDKKSPIILTKIYSVFNQLDSGYVCILEGMHEKNIIPSILFGGVEPNNEKDFLCIFIKSNNISSSMTFFHQ